MAFIEDLHREKRKKEFEEKEREQHAKILRLRREQKFKELESGIRDALDALGLATWPAESGKRSYEIFCDRDNFQFTLASGSFEYVLKVIFEEEGPSYYEIGVMGNMARSLDTSKKSLEHVIKTIYKRGPNYLGDTGEKKERKKKK